MRSAVALTVLAFFLCQAGDVSARRRSKKRPKPPATKVGTGGNAIAEGKAHLKKANALAGEDSCEAAIKEYTAAYDKLGDPVVLFNRGECYRRLGDGANAIEDYEDFLEEVPNAPNRTDIEAKIAALQKTVKAPPPEPEESPEAAAKTAAPAPTVRRASPPTAPETPAPRAEAAFVEPRVIDAPPDEGPRSLTWVWVALGVLAAGGIAGAYLAFRPGDPTPPPTSLGNYSF